MGSNDIERFFPHEFRPVVRGTLVSPHPASQQLSKGLGRFALLFGTDYDLEEKLESWEIELGRAFDSDSLIDGTPVKVSRELICANVLVVGTVGSGKTNFILQLLRQLQQLSM